MNAFSNVFRRVAPGWAARRAAARLGADALRAQEGRAEAKAGITDALAVVARNLTAGYDGAARTHRTAGRKIGSTSADREIWSSLVRLRDVHRELMRNNPYATRAGELLPANIIGPGISLSLKHRSKKTTDALGTLVKKHLLTTKIDFDGRQNYYGLQRLVMRTVVEAGECLIIRHRPKASLKLPVPLQVRVIEPDYLVPYVNDSVLIGTIPDGNAVIQGIEYDKAGQRVAYHIYKTHPGALYGGFYSETLRIPAEDVIHVYRQDRPGQSRGVPWGAPVIMTLWDLGDYEDAELMRQKIAACFAVFWIDNNGQMKLAQSPTESTPTWDDMPVDMLEPGMQQRLPPGVDVKFATPPTVVGYDPFTRAQVRKIALGYGVPYEALAGDYSQVNFSSARMGWLEFQRIITHAQQQMMIPHFCQRVAEWFLDAAEIVVPGATLADVHHTEPRREMIDPTKEIPAMRDGIRSGLLSRSDAVRSMGEDPYRLDEEIAGDNERADGLKLRFDSDGRFAIGAPMQPVSQDVKLPGDPKGNQT